MLVLRGKTGRNGEVKSFDVVRAEDGTVTQVLHGLAQGDYKVLNGERVHDATVAYRTVQDITLGGDEIFTVEA